MDKRTWFGYCLACLCIAASVTASVSADKPKKTPADDSVKASDDWRHQFRFARMKYPGGIPDYIKNWYTDYPNMDSNLTTLAHRLTIIDVGEPILVEPASADIFKYPLVYSVEPEQMVLGPEEVANLREYLARGGLWFADDFHGDEEFDAFVAQIHRVLPNAKIVELNTSHPLFHCFYNIDKIVQVTNDGIAKCHECDQWENGPSGKIPKDFAVFDERGRISILMAWNTDLGDGLEWADDPDYPGYYSAYAFRFVTNVIVYAMTH
jgi:hypothetical protein